MERYEAKAQGGRAQRRDRKPEWECSADRCGKRTFVFDRESGERSWQCRRCGKWLDMSKDAYVDEGGQRSWWPNELLTRPPCDDQPTGARRKPPQWPGTQKQQQQQQQQQQQPPARPFTAKEQLKNATDGGLPEWILEELRAQVSQEEEAARQQRPIGQRLDSARASLKKAVEKAERAEWELDGVHQRLAQAKEEVEEWHAAVEALTVEAACAREVTELAPIAETMEMMLEAVESTWSGGTGIPQKLHQALSATRACLEQMRSPSREPAQARAAVGVKEEPEDAA